MAVEGSEEEKCWRHLLLLLERQGGLKFAEDFAHMIYVASREEEMSGLIAAGWPAGMRFTTSAPVPSRGPTGVRVTPYKAKYPTKAEYVKAIEEQRNAIIKKGNQS